jgi:hypothetical protein
MKDATDEGLAGKIFDSMFHSFRTPHRGKANRSICKEPPQ